MTRAGSIRRCASRMATRRISWSAQGTSELGPLRGFWGRPVRTLPHAGQHRKGQPHQADVPMPAVPGARLVVSEPELRLGGLKRVLDRPPTSLDADQGLDRRAGRAPGGEVGPLATAEAAADQQPARPQPGEALVVLARLQIGQLTVGPVVQPLTLRARPGRQALPRSRAEAIGNVLGGAGDLRLVDPRVEAVARA